MKAGRPVSRWSEEAEDAEGAEREAVDGERGQGPGLEPADEEPHRQVGGDPADDHTEDDLTVDMRPGRAEQRGDLERACRQRRRTTSAPGLSHSAVPRCRPGR